VLIHSLPWVDSSPCFTSHTAILAAANSSMSRSSSFFPFMNRSLFVGIIYRSFIVVVDVILFIFFSKFIDGFADNIGYGGIKF